jgi:hypothetical protein
MGGEHLMNRYKTKSEFEVYFNLLMLKKYESNFIRAKKIDNYMRQFKKENG